MRKHPAVGLRIGSSLVVLAGLFCAISGHAQLLVERVSVVSDGTQANGYSSHASISADGQHVAFVSAAMNLVPADTNGQRDVFVRDRLTQVTERASVSSSGAEADYFSSYPFVDADGSAVAFWSCASNLIVPDNNPCPDVLLRDRSAGQTEDVSIGTTPPHVWWYAYPAGLSFDGSVVGLTSWSRGALVPEDTNDLDDVYVRDRSAGTTERVSVSSDGSQADAACGGGWLSGTGRYVVFSSSATNLVPGDTNGCADIFVRDRVAGTTERVSLSSSGAQGDADSSYGGISADGRYVVFSSSATNLVPDDTNARTDVFVRDRVANTTVRVSVSSTGVEGDDHSGSSSISADGRYVAFASDATNLVTGDINLHEDVFVRDLIAGDTYLVSYASDGSQANDDCDSPTIAQQAPHIVAYGSSASNLVPGDTNGTSDIFVVAIGPLAVRWPRYEAAAPRGFSSIAWAIMRCLLAPLWPVAALA